MTRTPKMSIQEEYDARKFEGQSDSSPGNKNLLGNTDSELPSIYQTSNTDQIKADAYSRAIAHLNKQK